jgi:hypothetical protein
MLAAMERCEIIIMDDMLAKLVPPTQEEQKPIIRSDRFDRDINTSFPVDKNILEIAKKIMSGKVQ